MRLQNLLKAAIAAIAGNFFYRKIPLNLVLSATNRCNPDCVYCKYNYRSHNELSAGQIINLIDEMADIGV